MWQALIILAVTCHLSQGLQEGPVVNTPLGKVSGWESQWPTRSGRSYQAWTSIPYAQPPVGKLRFMPPKPLLKWKGILNATGVMPRCLQLSGAGKTVGQEDCLYLSVYRPKIPRETKLPVLFFVHGGAFQTGDSAGPRHIADYLMAEDVVLVLIHYRLNGFGFMSMGDKVLPGNFGLKDQVMALRWVKQNIASFGGDPNSVTVFGTSAGGASAHYLLKSPQCNDLVTRAVSDSGTINHVWSLMKTSIVKDNTLQIAKYFKCPTSKSRDIVKCLQKVDATVLMQAIGSLTPPDMALKYLFGPVIEPKEADDAFATEDLSLRPSNKPWITSIANGEYMLYMFLSRALPKEYMENISRNVSGYVYEWVRQHTSDPYSLGFGSYLLEKGYLLERGSDTEFRKDLAKGFAIMHGDNGFIYPAVYNMLLHQGPKWMYSFEYKGEGLIDPTTGKPFPDDVAFHASEGNYYFNFKPNETVSDREVSLRLIRYLVNFARFSDPAPQSMPLEWNQFAAENPVTLRITAKGDFLGDRDFSENLYGLWWTWNTTIAWN